MNTTTSRFAITLLLLMMSQSAYPCTVAPEHLSDSPRDLVASSPIIVMARATQFAKTKKYWPGTMEFEVIELLRGDPGDAISLSGYQISDELKTTDFESHTDPRFWAYGIGNAIEPEDCGAYGVFEVGGVYLLVLRDTPHRLSYEKVESSDDLWLKVVRTLVTDQAEIYSRAFP